MQKLEEYNRYTLDTSWVLSFELKKKGLKDGCFYTKKTKFPRTRK